MKTFINAEMLAVIQTAANSPGLFTLPELYDRLHEAEKLLGQLKPGVAGVPILKRAIQQLQGSMQARTDASGLPTVLPDINEVLAASRWVERQPTPHLRHYMDGGGRLLETEGVQARQEAIAYAMSRINDEIELRQRLSLKQREKRA